jgi:hypothetical protein
MPSLGLASRQFPFLSAMLVICGALTDRVAAGVIALMRVVGNDGFAELPCPTSGEIPPAAGS